MLGKARVEPSLTVTVRSVQNQIVIGYEMSEIYREFCRETYDKKTIFKAKGSKITSRETSIYARLGR